MQTFLRFAVALAMALALPAVAEEIVTIPTRSGVTQSFLLTLPDSGKPAAVVLLFPGGEGAIHLRMDAGRIRFGQGNFVVRSRGMFVDGGLAAVVLDAPSDFSQGMEDVFRLSDKHVQDITAVMADIKKRFPNTPVFLVGTSRGTISAASVGRAMGDTVAGVVLTSTVFLANRRNPGLSGFDYAAIRAPLLFVHHVEDSCAVTPYRNAKELSEKYPLISVRGGEPPRSGPCEPFAAHGYLGKEAPTVEAIVNWMLKKPYASEVN